MAKRAKSISNTVRRIVLVERFDIASYIMGPRYLKKDELCQHNIVGKKCEERSR